MDKGSTLSIQAKNKQLRMGGGARKISIGNKRKSKGTKRKGKRSKKKKVKRSKSKSESEKKISGLGRVSGISSFAAARRRQQSGRTIKSSRRGKRRGEGSAAGKTQRKQKKDFNPCHTEIAWFLQTINRTRKEKLINLLNLNIGGLNIATRNNIMSYLNREDVGISAPNPNIQSLTAKFSGDLTGEQIVQLSRLIRSGTIDTEYEKNDAEQLENFKPHDKCKALWRTAVMEFKSGGWDRYIIKDIFGRLQNQIKYNLDSSIYYK